METVEKLFFNWPLCDGARFSTPERVENAELEVDVEREVRRAPKKQILNTTKTARLIAFHHPRVFIRGHLYAELWQR